MKLGLIGLTGSGKTTLFNSLMKAKEDPGAKASKKLNIKMVPVPDARLDELEIIFKPKKKTPAYIEFVDLAGLEPGGGGAGNRFLQNIREVDALIQVIRAYGQTDSRVLEDIDTINLELIIADLGSVEKRIENIERQSRSNDPALEAEKKVLEEIKDNLENDLPARNAQLGPKDLKLIRSMGLLTLKPVIYCLNIDENNVGKKEIDLPLLKTVREKAEKDHSELVTVCASLEEELAQLEAEDRADFMQELKIDSSALQQLIKSSYRILNLISFLTAGSDEVRAWTIRKGDRAPAAASVIHSDIERGFIRAETVSFSDFIQSGTFIKAREMGLMRSEGKQYEVQDGDIIDFRFNV